MHRPQPAPAAAPRRPVTVLVAAAGTVSDADRALAAGADLIDRSGLIGADAAALRARHPGALLWTGAPAAVDADRVAAGPGAEPAPVAAVVTAAAISAWLGTPAIRTRHVLAVRRAIDMTHSIAGTRPPARTVRGLA
jgi:dihydropteroate synthase